MSQCGTLVDDELKDSRWSNDGAPLVSYHSDLYSFNGRDPLSDITQFISQKFVYNFTYHALLELIKHFAKFLWRDS